MLPEWTHWHTAQQLHITSLTATSMPVTTSAFWNKTLSEQVLYSTIPLQRTRL